MIIFKDFGYFHFVMILYTKIKMFFLLLKEILQKKTKLKFYLFEMLSFKIRKSYYHILYLFI